MPLLFRWLLVSSIASACALQSVAAENDFALIKSRLYERYLVAPGPVPHVAGAVLDEPVSDMVARLDRDGRWPDLIYHDATVPIMRPMPHLYRLVRMTQVYRAPATPPDVKKTLRGPIHAALRFWLSEKPMAANGWFNTIGVPNEIAKVAVLMGGELDGAERAGCIEILKRAKQDGVLIYSGAPATGQNLLWQAGLQIVAGCLEESEQDVRQFARRAAEEITVTTEEGVQPDFSFHQHGAQLYSGGYGEGFAVDGAFWAGVLRGTRFAWPEKTIDVLSAFILDGQQWMSRGRMWDFGVLGREVARMDKDASKLALACDALADLHTRRAREFEAFAARLRREKNAAGISGNRSFWRSDFMSHIRPEFYVSARMTSRRMLGSESGNGEAIFNYHLGDGAMCVMKTGEEYRNIFPVWNWRRIPGVTCIDSDEPLPEQAWAKGSNGGSDFAGGVSDGEFGAAAFELRRAGLHGFKSWFFLPGGVVCLGAELRSDVGSPRLITTVNQCWADDVAVINGRERRAGEAGAEPVSGWVHHDGVGYFFEEGAAVHVTRETRTGRWSRINLHHRGAIDATTGDVFSLWIDHGSNSGPVSYRYIVAPDLPRARAADYLQTTAPEVVANSADVQAAAARDGGVRQAIFWRAGEVTFSDGLTIEVDRAAALQIRRSPGGFSVSVADPTQTQTSVNVRVNRRLDGEGCTAEASGTVVAFALPSGPDAGRSLRRSFKLAE